MRHNPLIAATVYIQHLNLVITVPADVLAPNGARPSAGTVLTENLDMFSFNFTGFWWFCDIIMDQWRLSKSHRTSECWYLTQEQSIHGCQLRAQFLIRHDESVDLLSDRSWQISQIGRQVIWHFSIAILGCLFESFWRILIGKSWRSWGDGHVTPEVDETLIIRGLGWRNQG